MRTIIDCKPGEFYELAGLYFLPTYEIKAGTSVSMGQPMNLQCMFDLWIAMQGEQRCGFLFRARFETVNAGTYLLTRLRSKGQATEVEVLLKHDDLVIYHYGSVGTLAISPRVNEEIETILTEQ